MYFHIFSLKIYFFNLFEKKKNLKCFQAVTMFDSMMKEIMDQVGGLSSQNTELCALLRNILQVLQHSAFQNGTVEPIQLFTCYIMCIALNFLPN